MASLKKEMITISISDLILVFGTLKLSNEKVTVNLKKESFVIEKRNLKRTYKISFGEDIR